MLSIQQKLAVYLCLIGAVLITGCSTTQPGNAARGTTHPTKPPVSAVPNVGVPQALTDPATLVLPVQAYLPTGQQITDEQQALYKLEAECLMRYGFTWIPPVLPPTSDGGYNARRYGIPGSLEIARDYGFHIAGQQSTVRSSPLSSAEKSVLYGYTKTTNGISVPDGGCVTEAGRKLSNGAGILSSTGSTAASIKGDSFVVSQADPRVIAAQRRWSACMSRGGYHFKNSLDERMLAMTSPGPAPSSTEITVAVLAWTCGKQSNLVGTWFGVESAYQRAQIDKHVEELSQEKQELDRETAAVEKVLGKTGA